MESITVSTNQILYLGLFVLIYYVGRKIADALLDNWLKKTNKDYVTEEICVKRRREFKSDCEVNQENALASLKPILQKLVKSDIKNRKILHLLCTKLGIEEKIIASLINGEDDE
jgi:hypothetical protein